ncbi:MAG: DUF1850 domain-containing protein [Desulfobacteraceae bacterium]|nr:DUF1850 domain-containing protein [Desulfobacteraceae bacterium]
MKTMTGPWLFTVYGVCGLVILLILTGMLVPGGLELWVMPVKGGPPLLVLPLEPGERFTIHYNHSVENSPIWETHSLDASGRIFIEEEQYLKFGAGMGKMPGVGRLVMRGPYEVIEEMHQPTGDFILRIGSPGVDHTIIWRDTRTNLSNIAPHTAVQFTGHQVCLITRMWRWVTGYPGLQQAVQPSTLPILSFMRKNKNDRYRQ